MAILVQSFSGMEAQAYLNDLAYWRITVFREFPYLYEGSLEYEKTYLQTFFQAPDAVLVLAFADGVVVGASTALPLQHETGNIKHAFTNSSFDIQGMFYYSESVLSKSFRGMGIGKQFFEHREAKAREWGAKWCCFCAVERPPHHPLRPDDYKALDGFWQQQGFVKQPGLTCLMDWQDVDQPRETTKSLVFWVKDLNK